MGNWVFQANPKRYDLVAAVERASDDNWAMNQHRKLVQVGDTVFFYLSGAEAGIYAIGAVTGPVFDAGDGAEFGRWKVDVTYTGKISPPILRQELISDPTTASVQVFTRAQGTNFVLPDDASARVREMAEGRVESFGADLSASLESWRTLDQARERHERQVREDYLQFLGDMDPGQFEQLVGLLLTEIGYEDVEVTGKTGDGGVDLTANLRLHGITEVPTAVQVKRWKNSVSPHDIRDLRGALETNQRGLFITTSRFTKAASSDANSPGKPHISLIDGAKLADLLIERGIGVESRPISLTRLRLERLQADLGESV